MRFQGMGLKFRVSAFRVRVLGIKVKGLASSAVLASAYVWVPQLHLAKIQVIAQDSRLRLLLHRHLYGRSCKIL